MHPEKWAEDIADSPYGLKSLSSLDNKPSKKQQLLKSIFMHVTNASMPDTDEERENWDGKIFEDFTDSMPSIYHETFKEQIEIQGIRYKETYKRTRSQGISKEKAEIIFCFSARARRIPLEQFLTEYIVYCRNVGVYKTLQGFKGHEETTDKILGEYDTNDKNISKNTSISAEPANQLIQPRLTIPEARENNTNYFANAVLDVIGRDEQKARLKAFLEWGKEDDKNVVWFQLAGVAGQGKSRLAYDLIKVATEELGFRAGFLTENDIEFFKDQWKDWQPDKPYLLIFDYVIGREQDIKPILQTLISKQAKLHHKIRILLVERQRWDQGSVTKIQNQGDKNRLRSSMRIGDKAEWFLKLCEKDDSEGERLTTFRFDNGVEELEMLREDDLIAIVKQLFSGKALTLSDNALRKTLNQIDSKGRPLYAYLLAQQLSESQQGYESWTKIDLLDYQLVRDKRRWEKAFNGRAPTWGDSHPAMKLAVLATIVREVKFQDTLIQQYIDNIDTFLRREPVAITSGNLINDDNRPHEIHGLEPDLLGEWFVLHCFNEDLDFEELLNISWQYSPDKTANFLQRIVQDFIDLSEKYNNWSLIEKLLEHIPSNSDEKHYKALANVSVAIAKNIDHKDLTIPSNIIVALEYASLSDTVAMNYLGFLYYYGIGVTRNRKKTVELYRRAVEQEDCEAMINLGFCYRYGNGVERDRKEAIDLYHQAAKLGSSRAILNLAACYEESEGRKQHWDKLIDLYQQAFQQGDCAAMFSLGLCYEEGYLVEQDLNKAIDLYQRSAEAGEREAVDRLKMISHIENFLSTDNYRIQKICGWANSKLPNLTEAPAFDPPIMTGDWKQLTTEELEICLEKITIPFEILELSSNLDGYIGQYARLTPLSFYKDCNLVDIQLYNPSNNDTLIFSAIFNTERALLLNGIGIDIINKLNRHLLSFDDKKSTTSYLQFYCSYARDPFQIISNLNEVTFDKNENRHIYDEIKASLFSLQYVEGNFENEGWQKFKGWALWRGTVLTSTLDPTVIRKSALFTSTFKVFADGNVSTENKVCVFDKLPILQRQYNGIFRTPLRSFSSI